MCNWATDGATGARYMAAVVLSLIEIVGGTLITESADVNCQEETESGIVHEDDGIARGAITVHHVQVGRITYIHFCRPETAAFDNVDIYRATAKLISHKLPFERASLATRGITISLPRCTPQKLMRQHPLFIIPSSFEDHDYGPLLFLKFPVEDGKQYQENGTGPGSYLSVKANNHDASIPENSATKVQFKLKHRGFVEAGIDFDVDFFLDSPEVFSWCGSSSDQNEDEH
jgi:hypothetical protein